MIPTERERGASRIDVSRAVWRKSAHSGGNGSCVEVAHLNSAVAIRDSKDPTGPKLIFSHDDWRTFIHNVKVGLHDL